MDGVVEGLDGGVSDGVDGEAKGRGFKKFVLEEDELSTEIT